MCSRRSHILYPLTELTTTKERFKCTDVEQKAFDDIKHAVSHDTLLAYSDFNKIFDIHTDASDHQLGAVISQEAKPISFYIRKLTERHKRYTVTENELLIIVETLKEFRTILLGQQLKIYTDHKNITFKHFNTDSVLRWRLI